MPQYLRGYQTSVKEYSPYSLSGKQNSSSCCLSCADYCGTCVSVCPNRANIAIPVKGSKQKKQIIHIDALCNECGNCAVFCPYGEGRPYRDKFTWFWSREAFDESENPGFYLGDDEIGYGIKDRVGEGKEGIRTEGKVLLRMGHVIETDFDHLIELDSIAVEIIKYIADLL